MKKLLTALLSTLYAVSVSASLPSEIILLSTFDYPGAGTTFANSINNRGDIAGDYRDTTGVYHGFVRLQTGKFHASRNRERMGPHLLELFEINETRTAVGRIVGSSRVVGEQGFFVNGDAFTYYSFPGAFDTALLAINDKGNFGGYASFNETFAAFVSIGGTAFFLDLPDEPLLSETHALNNRDQVAGRYRDSFPDFASHGFFWSPDGALTAPIDYPGAADTNLLGMNEEGLLVGNYNNTDQVLHGCVVALPDTFLSYDYPGAIATTLNGVNSSGVITGSYTDAAGVSHGFLAQVQ